MGSLKSLAFAGLLCLGAEFIWEGAVAREIHQADFNSSSSRFLSGKALGKNKLQEGYELERDAIFYNARSEELRNVLDRYGMIYNLYQCFGVFD